MSGEYWAELENNHHYWVGVNNITSFLMERLNDRE